MSRNFALAELMVDRYTITPHDLSGTLYTASYNVSLSPKSFFEAKLADQTSDENKHLAVGGFDVDEATRIKQQDPRFPGNPDGGPDMPGNNFNVYTDGSGWHNGWLLDNGYGRNEYPRTQANLTLTQFATARHELKYGIDAQAVEWLGDVAHPNVYSAGGNNYFDATSPSGYTNSLSANPLGVACDVFRFEGCVMSDYNHPSLLADLGSNDTRSENVAIYARDRFNLGDHWTFNAGLRVERQRHENDVGREVMDSTDISPRLSMAYDIEGDGRRLITAFAGRSYHQLPQEAINAYLQDHFNGYNGFELRLFLDCAFVPCVEEEPDLFFPLPLGYVVSLGFVLPGFMWDLVDAGVFESDLEPYYKDEAILGYEWLLGSNWALDAKAIWWEAKNLIGSTTQLAELDGRLVLFDFTANHGDYPAILNAIREAAAPEFQGRLAQADVLARYQEPERNYRALQLQVNRRFNDNWALYSNVTWSEAGGSSHGDVFNNTNDDYGMALEQVLTEADLDFCQQEQVYRAVPVDCHSLEQFIGEPLSTIQRDGRPAFDHTVIAKSTGWKVFPIGQKQRFSIGGNLTWQTGKPWRRVEGMGGTVITEGDSIPFGVGVVVPIDAEARELASHWWLNGSIAYGFPLVKKVTGEVRLEVQNVTDNQEQIDTNQGEVRVARRGFQHPRRLRALIGFSF